MGFVEDEVKKLVEQMKDLGVTSKLQGIDIGNMLGMIEEGSEDDDDEEDSDDDNENSDDDENHNDLFDFKEELKPPFFSDYDDLQDAYFPQAFSHFTYHKSKGSFMVVDLQGVFTVKNDGAKVYELTDPVIHQHSRRRYETYGSDRSNQNYSPRKKWDFGRTDRGINGMKAFFETHKCTDACRLLGLSEVDFEKCEEFFLIS